MSGERTGEEGFVLALVVLLLYIVAVMGAAGYAVVTAEAFQSQQSSETDLALAVAQGGLAWFAGSQPREVLDVTTYSINGGTATLTTRKIATLSDHEDLYLIKSEGSYTDPRYPSIPALRTVYQHAVYHPLPLSVLAPVMSTGGTSWVYGRGKVYGSDDSAVGACSSAVGATIAGVAGRKSTKKEGKSSVLIGSPTGLKMGTFEDVTDGVDARWDLYADPNFPVDYDDPEWPNFGSLPSDSFPVVRVNGDFSPTMGESGRGVLIVTGELSLENYSLWTWYGIVIVGSIDHVQKDSYSTVYGTLVGGLGTDMGAEVLIEGSTFKYNSCAVEGAGRSLAHFTPIENSWWEDTRG